MNEKVMRLVKEHSFNKGTAKAYIEAQGKCVYCGFDLLDGLSTYFSATIDHLLPKSEYPEVEDFEENWVLSCCACNLMKGKMCIDVSPWSAIEAVTKHKQEVIDMIIEKIKDKQMNRIDELNKIKNIIQAD